MWALGAVSNAVGIPVAPDLMLVVEDSENARAAVETSALATVPLDATLSSAEDISQFNQGIQQTLGHQTAGIDCLRGDALFLRGPLPKIDMAHALADNLLRPRGSAVIEFEIITVSRGSTVRAGIHLPSSFPVANFSTLFGAMPAADGAERPRRLWAAAARFLASRSVTPPWKPASTPARASRSTARRCAPGMACRPRFRGWGELSDHDRPVFGWRSGYPGSGIPELCSAPANRHI